MQKAMTTMSLMMSTEKMMQSNCATLDLLTKVILMPKMARMIEYAAHTSSAI